MSKITQKQLIYQKNYLSLYIGEYNKKKVFVKEYNKIEYKKFHSYDFNEQNNKENIIDLLIIDKFENNIIFSIIMKYIDVNILDYLKITEKTLTYEEIREIFIKINKILIFIKDNNIKYNFNISNLILPLDIINSETIKLIGNKEIINNNQNYYYEIYNLGKILYFFLFKKNPENENKLFLERNINSITNKNLKNLISQMLDKTRKISISEYLRNSFFNKKLEYNQNIQKFHVKCNKHFKNYYYYCCKCSINICELCINEHIEHKYIPFSQIGLNDNEINKMHIFLDEIKKNLQKLNKIMNEFERILLNLNQNKYNKNIYDNNEENNFKNYYFYNLNLIKNITKFKTDLNIIDYSLEKNGNLIFTKFNLFKEKNEEIKESEKKEKEETKKKMKEEEINVKIINQNYENDIKEIYIDNKINNSSNYNLKKGKYCITIKFNKNLNNISNMFLSCNFLTYIDLSNLIFNEINDMSFMFNGCSNLKYLNLSNINTKNITKMNGLFYKCFSLKKLNLSSFNTVNVENINEMFYDCHSLKQLDLSNFVTNKIIDMDNLFYHCSSLISIDLSNFITSKVEKMKNMFYNCNNLININLSNFKLINVSDLSNMFKSCINLLSIDLPNFDNNNISNISQMFLHCHSLTSLDLSKFNTKNVNQMNGLFAYCKSLISLDLSNFNTKNVTNMGQMFSNCCSLIYLNLSSFDTQNVTNMNNMFSECSSLSTLDLSKFQTQKVKYMGNMFSKCYSLLSLDLSNFQTQNVENMECMFYDCNSLKKLNLLNFNINNLKNMKAMFYNLNVNCEIISNNQVILRKNDEKYENINQKID